MWIAVECKKNNYQFFIKHLKKKIKDKLILYYPKLKIEKFYRNKKIFKEVNLIKNYVFCYSKKFDDKKYLNSFKYIRGLKYILSGYHDSQNQIKAFIEKCRNKEDNEGYLLPSFFDVEINKKYKFDSGPFLNHIFKVVEINKNKFKIVMGNKVTTVKKNYLINAL